jgi:hypothetical protein
MTKYYKCGREFLEADIKRIQRIVKENHGVSRCQLSRLVCEAFDWYSENGTIKGYICRQLLLTLEKDNYIKLPSPDPRSFNRFKKKRLEIEFKEPNNVLDGKVGDYDSIELRRVSSKSENTLWQYLVDRYHYLGYNGVIGRFQKYIATSQSIPVACLGWTDASWKVAVRDDWIGWDKPTRVKQLKHIVNNFRFIIFPWVKIKYLASHLLSRNVSLLRNDWKKQYNVDVLLFETFVEKNRFSGTCYKAANWLYLGETRGYCKGKDVHIKHNIIKDVYIYIPEKNSKEMLLWG